MTLYGAMGDRATALQFYDQVNLHSAWDAVTVWFEHHVPPATLLGGALLGYENLLIEIDATILREARS